MFLCSLAFPRKLLILLQLKGDHLLIYPDLIRGIGGFGTVSAQVVCQIRRPSASHQKQRAFGGTGRTLKSMVKMHETRKPRWTTNLSASISQIHTFPDLNFAPAFRSVKPPLHRDATFCWFGCVTSSDETPSPFESNFRSQRVTSSTASSIEYIWGQWTRICPAATNFLNWCDQVGMF